MDKINILFLTDNFPPEGNAPAVRTAEHIKEWSRFNAETTVITGAPNFPHGKVFAGYKNRKNQFEILDGIKTHRVLTYIAANKGFFKRILDYLSFGISGFWRSLFIKTDIIIATSPQFFTAIGGLLAASFKRKPWIMEVRDLWPESIAAVGALSKNSFSYRILTKIELFLYRHSNAIVVVTNAFKKHLVNRGIPESKITVITNGVNKSQYFPVSKNVEILRALNLEGKFIVGYLGTHGLAHKLDFILKAAKKMEERKEVHFLLIGDGAEKSKLSEMAKSLDLRNVTLLPPVNKSEIKNYISILDVALVNLKKSDTFKSVIPSKIFENAAMNKPILLGVEGESKRIIEKYKAGICFEPENEHDFLNKVQLICTNKVLYNNCLLGCQELTQNFDRKKLAKEMLELVAGVCDKKLVKKKDKIAI